MSDQFEVTIDKGDVEQRLGELKEKAPQVIARGLNYTAQQARRRLADKAREVYTVKIGGFQNHVKFQTRATASHLVAVLGVDGRTITLNRFSIRQGGAYASVVKATGFKELRRHPGGLAWMGKGGSVSGRVTQRIGSKRYPLKVLHGPSVPAMVGSKERVYGVVEPHINSDLRNNISKEIAKLVG